MGQIRIGQGNLEIKGSLTEAECPLLEQWMAEKEIIGV